MWSVKKSEPDPQDERLKKAQKKWLKRIKREKDIHEDFRDQASEAWAVYLDDTTEGDVYYPLLWSVVNVQHAAVYSDKPKPDIRPRNTDRNPAYKDAADIMQRALEFYLDNTEFDDNMHRVVDDYLVAGLGVPRVKLDAEIIEIELDEPVVGMDGEEVDTESIIANQTVRLEHHPWPRFGWEPCTNWAHVDWIYFEHRMTKAEIRRRWGDDVDLTPSDSEYSRQEKDRRRKSSKSASATRTTSRCTRYGTGATRRC